MKSTGLKFLLSTAFCFIAICGWSQAKKISGKITDENNNPISGASIVINGKTMARKRIQHGNV